MTDRPMQHDQTDDHLAAEPTAERADLVAHREEVDVRTEWVPRGRVVLRKRIVEEEQTVTVTVRREEVEIVEEDLSDEMGSAPSGSGRTEGVGVGTGAGADMTGTQHARDAQDSGEDVEVIVYAERPVVSMEVVPVERIVVKRRTTTDERTISTDVSHEEIVVEGDGLGREGDGPERERGEADFLR